MAAAGMGAEHPGNDLGDGLDGAAADRSLGRRRLLASAGLAVTAAAACCVPPGRALADEAAPLRGGRGSPLPLDPNHLTGDAHGFPVQLYLLGTGAGMSFNPGRAGMSSVLVVGGRPYLIDAGAGAGRRIFQAGIDPAAIGAAFITHQHADHLADLFSLFWLPFHAGTPKNPIQVFGPGPAGGFPRQTAQPVPVVYADDPTPGIREVLEEINRGYAYETNISAAEFPAVRSPLDKVTGVNIMPPPSAGAGPDNTAPAMEPFPVFEDDRVRVTAILVPHGPVFPSYGYRFDTEHGSVVFSGDTSKSDNVARLADGSSLLVHEVIDIDYYAGQGASPVLLEHLRATHTTPQEVGEIASDAGTGTVVLSHLAPGSSRAVTDGSWARRVRSTYRGKVVVGHDLHRMGAGTRH